MNTMIYHMMDLIVRDLKSKAGGPFCVIPSRTGKPK